MGYDLDLSSLDICGRRNFLVIACHYDPVWCLEAGSGVQFDAWDHSQSTPYCAICPPGTHSLLSQRAMSAVIPYPLDMSPKINTCVACADGKYCPMLTSCLPEEV